MKKLIFIVVIGVSLGLSTTVHAAGLTFTKFAADVVINNDASITVTENITANFPTAQHGIFRNIPFRFTTLDGGQSSIPISIVSVTQDGQPVKYTESINDTEVIVKIGDPNKTISGTHQYTISYSAHAATNFFDDHDELYWNVTGDQWDAPISNISASVQFANGVMDANGIPPTISQVACYTGRSGSTATNCQATKNTNSAQFSSQEFLTIVVGWPKGFVNKPPNFDELRSQGTTVAPNPIFQRPSWATLILNIVAILIVLSLMMRHWFTHGRDQHQRKTIIAQYDPPQNMRPAELYGIMHEQTPMKLLLPATIVDVAVRGYLQIREIEKKKFLGFGEEKDYELQLLKPADEKLHVFEKKIIETLFDVEYIEPSDKPTIVLSELKKRKYTSNPFSPAMSSITDWLVSEQYFTSNPLTAKVIVGVSGVVMIGITIFLLSLGIFAWGGIVAGLIIFGFIPAMPKRSAKGVEAVWVGQGFRLFIEKAEKYRVQWQERENIFEQFLPYAMIFGLADKWSKALADVAHQPDWYVGSSNQTFNSLVFFSALNNFSSVTTKSVVSAAASGSSGFSGGSSGGGGGGGGGGGW